MNLVKNLQTTLDALGIEHTVTYSEDEAMPMLHLPGEWNIGVDGAMLNVGLGPYAVNHPEDEDGNFQLSPPLITPDDVVEYLRSQGALRKLVLV